MTTTTIFDKLIVVNQLLKIMGINTKKIIDYWITTAEHNYNTAKFLFKGRRYPECLFFCHLMIEKILKALVVKHTKLHAPHTHKLVRLAGLANINLTTKQFENLTTITEFNIATRYYEIKFDFYKKCTRAYTEKYFLISQELYLWLKEKIYLKK